jgi:hypothetical protein
MTTTFKAQIQQEFRGSTPHKTILLYNVVKNQSHDTTPRELACLDLIVGMMSLRVLECLEARPKSCTVREESQLTLPMRDQACSTYCDRPSLLRATGIKMAIQHAAARGGRALLLACAQFEDNVQLPS